MIMCVPSARRIFAPPSLGARLDGLASNSDAADDRGSLGRSRSLLTLGTTLPYGGRLPAPRCGPEAHEAAPHALVGDGISGGWTSCAGRPGTGDIAETYENLRCRGTGRRDELTARRCAGSQAAERSSINLGPHNGTRRTGRHQIRPIRRTGPGKRRDTWSDSYAGDAGPTPGCEAAHARRRLTRGSCDGPGRSASAT
jgi:hypothetical protein